jgi:hypothetical protein
MHKTTLFFATIATIATISSAQALEAYSDQQSQQFMDWCTGAKSASESTCSCTVKSVAQTVPATALTQFLSSQASGGGFSFNATLATTAALVTQALTSCASK